MREQVRFVVFDGVEGCGKSTQIRRVAETLAGQGMDVLVTHEPGGTVVGEAIRELLLSPHFPQMHPLTEAMLFCASRAQHVREVISPALGEGRVVLCDRFEAATCAYQGYAGGIGMDLVERISAEATGPVRPDLTIILDLEPAEGMRRKFGEEFAAGAWGDRIERRAPAFHEQVRRGYLLYARRHADRCAVVDAGRSPDAVFADIAALLQL